MYIQIKDLKKQYGKDDNVARVLKGISLDIEKADIVSILGPSGSGKSTLLNIIGGIDVLNSGSVKIGELELAGIDKSKLENYRRQKLGFIFQFYNLIPNLTVKENIETGAYLSKNPLDIDEILDELGLTEHKDKFPNQLSGGQQQRTGIGRAIVKRPEILICDEPTGALDYQSGKDVLSLIEKVNKKYSCTVLMATHNTEIAKMSTRIIKLHDGMVSSQISNTNIVPACELEW